MNAAQTAICGLIFGALIGVPIGMDIMRSMYRDAMRRRLTPRERGRLEARFAIDADDLEKVKDEVERNERHILQ